MARNVRTAPPRRSTRLAAVPEVSEADREVIPGEPGTGPSVEDRCRPCKGYGLVRGIGRRAGAHYTSVSGAQAALAAGRAVDCPACGGLGVTELAVGVA
jgi:hypothetical protein